MKTKAYNRKCLITIKLLLVIFPLIFTNYFSFATNYVTISNGNWTNGSIWAGGIAPGSTINAGDTVRIINTVIYNNGSDLEVLGALIVVHGNFSTPIGAGRSVFIRNTGSLSTYGSVFRIPMFNSSGGQQSGNLINEGGKLLIEYSEVEIAQNWTALSGAKRKFVGGCLTLGGNYQIDGASIDSNINTCIRMGYHGSSNFDVSGNSTLYLSNSKILLRGTSGNFNNSGGCSILGGAGSITALDMPGNLINDGTWSSGVANYCIDGSINGSNAAQVTSNLPGSENCALVNTDTCTGCNINMILPVKLTRFSSYLQDSKVILKWQAASEYDLLKYEIQKSDRANTFETIGYLPAKNTGAGSYSYTDIDNISQLTYYRLCMIDRNSSKSYSSIIKIDPNLKRAEIVVFPTVFENSLNIEVNNMNAKWSELVLHDSQGRILRTEKYVLTAGNNNIHLQNLASLSKGVYLLQVKFSEGQQSLSQKLLKQ